MSYLIYFGIVVAAGGALLLVSDAFAHEVSRVVEAMFERVEYRLALRAHERRSFRQNVLSAQGSNASVKVTPFRLTEGQRKGSTQQLGVARVAA